MMSAPIDDDPLMMSPVTMTTPGRGAEFIEIL